MIDIGYWIPASKYNYVQYVHVYIHIHTYLHIHTLHNMFIYIYIFITYVYIHTSYIIKVCIYIYICICISAIYGPGMLPYGSVCICHASVMHPYAHICIHTGLLRMRMPIFITPPDTNQKSPNCPDREFMVAFRGARSF